MTLALTYPYVQHLQLLSLPLPPPLPLLLPLPLPLPLPIVVPFLRVNLALIVFQVGETLWSRSHIRRNPHLCPLLQALPLPCFATRPQLVPRAALFFPHRALSQILPWTTRSAESSALSFLSSKAARSSSSKSFECAERALPPLSRFLSLERCLYSL